MTSAANKKTLNKEKSGWIKSSISLKLSLRLLPLLTILREGTFSSSPSLNLTKREWNLLWSHEQVTSHHKAALSSWSAILQAWYPLQQHYSDVLTLSSSQSKSLTSSTTTTLALNKSSSSFQTTLFNSNKRKSTWRQLSMAWDIWCMTGSSPVQQLL